jgi:hypothetical protein
MAETTNLQKNDNFPKKKYMFSILKLKKAKNSYEGYPTDFFSQNRQKFPTSRKYTRINKRKQN